MTLAKPKIALCFFGIPRSLRFTHAHLERNVLAPLRALGDVTLYAHFFRQTEIANPRSKEFGVLDPDEHRVLDLDVLLEDASDCAEVQKLYDAVSPFGAGWNGDFNSLMNLCRQLVSLRSVTLRSLQDQPDLWVFVRPDLLYHDDLGPAVQALLAEGKPGAAIPYWQSCGGLNDRFCIAKGAEAAKAFGLRAEQALAYCQEQGGYLPAEVFLAHAMRSVAVQPIGQRASRVRFDGARRKERFDHPDFAKRIESAEAAIQNPKLRSLAISALRLEQALRHGPRYRGLNRDWAAIKAMPVAAKPKQNAQTEVVQ